MNSKYSWVGTQRLFRRNLTYIDARQAAAGGANMSTPEQISSQLRRMWSNILLFRGEL